MCVPGEEGAPPPAPPHELWSRSGRSRQAGGKNDGLLISARRAITRYTHLCPPQRFPKIQGLSHVPWMVLQSMQSQTSLSAGLHGPRPSPAQAKQR